MLTASFFDRPVLEVARDLVGATLAIAGVGGIVVETEAYDREDPASHSFGGRTPRNAAMFGPPGLAYVYRSYGLHWCFNIGCGPEGHGAAVLIRALEPTLGIETMRERRGLEALRLLCAGPGRLAQALSIDRRLDGLRVDRAPFGLTLPAKAPALVTGPRIGITKAAALPWRFGLAGSRYLSRPFPKAPASAAQ